MWYLCRKPLPEFIYSGFKRFERREHHVSRVFDESVLIFMMEGVLRFEEDGVLVELSEGEYYIQRAGLFQSGNAASERPSYLYLHFHATYSENEADGIPIRGRFNKSAIRALMEEYDRRYLAHESGFFALNGLMYELLAEIEHQVVPENTRTMIAKDIQRMISTECRSQLSLAQIAERYGYSEDYTIRLFKKEFGITPYQYLLKERLTLAEHLLLTTEKSVAEISREVGYNDFSTFYRDFRKRYGMSPTEKRAEGEQGGLYLHVMK